MLDTIMIVKKINLNFTLQTISNMMKPNVVGFMIIASLITLSDKLRVIKLMTYI